MHTIRKTDLAQFTGTEVWYRHQLRKNILYTEGIQYLAEKAGAYWLIDEIAFNQMQPRIGSEEFQVWTLKTNLESSKADLTCENGNGRVLYTKEISFTDFPLDEIRIFFANNVILLTSEY